MRVYIKQGSTASTAYQLDPGVVITLGGVSVGVSGNTVAIAADAGLLIEGATAGKYVRTINGVSPDRDGDFLIEGSGCVSWSYTDEDVVVRGSSVHGALLLTDMCPSCTTCENIYRLQHELEVMKVNINTLKDVSLYDESTAVIKRDQLKALMVTGGSSACGVYDESDILTTRAAWLFREYVTMLHMWNYVVSINNASTVIQLAPESTAGFVVQTKHAVTSCDKQTSIQCDIRVARYSDSQGGSFVPGSAEVTEPASYSVMSIFVPSDSLSFTYKPFSDATPSPEDPMTATCTTGPEATTKLIKSAPYPLAVNAAGTYILEAKFLPFIPSESKVGNTVITSTNWGTITGSTTHVAGSTSTTYDYTIHTEIAESPLATPTREQYMRSNIAPTAVVDGRLRWKIIVTWTLNYSDGTKDIKTESWIYTCNAVGVPCGNDITTSSEIVDDVEPNT